jgi:putative acetyltransferase
MTPPDLIIRNFLPGDGPDFARLNSAWINAMFVMESHDRAALENPEASILAPGGQIVMVAAKGEAVGCCALIRMREGVYELAKMTVSETLRGQGIGRRLLVATIARAVEVGAHTLFLRSNSVLTNAVHLYESLGFYHVEPAAVPLPAYVRTNVWMRLDLPA